MSETKSDVPSLGSAGQMGAVLLGSVFGIDAVGHCLAVATIFFAAGLSAGLGLATALFLLASMAATLVIYRLGGFRQPLAIAQDTSISILAPAVALAAAGAAGPTEAKVATAFAVIGTSAILSGVVFWLVGHFRLGRLIRMFPYSVAAGFLASSGFLLVIAALSLLTHESRYSAMLDAMIRTDVLSMLLPAVVMALLLLAAVRMLLGAAAIGIVAAAALAGYHLAMAAMGLDSAEAVARGFLVPAASSGGDSLSFDPKVYALIDWPRVLAVAPTIAVVILINLFGFLLNFAGVELGTRSDVDENRELRITGLSNIVTGSVGGQTAYLQGGASVMVDRIRPEPRWFMAGFIIVCAAGVILADMIVGTVPIFISAGLLLFIGLSMIGDWLIAAPRRLPLEDKVVIFGIVAMTLVFGIMPAIGAGLLLAVLGFAIGFARVPLIRQTSDAARRQSAYDRSPEERAALAGRVEGVRILHLQGALFFGSVDGLIDRVKRLRERPGGLVGLILDFSDVSRFDSSAAAALSKLTYLLGDLPAGLHLSGLPGGVENGFARWGLPMRRGWRSDQPGFAVWDDIDSAIESCEDQLLRAAQVRSSDGDIGTQISALCAGNPRASDLTDLLEPIDLTPGARLFDADTSGQDIFFLESGRLGVHLRAADGQQSRVRSMGPGAVIGELAYVTGQPRTADIVAECPSRVWRLTGATIARIEKDDLALYAQLNLVLARALAAKVVQTNDLLMHERVREDRSRPGP